MANKKKSKDNKIVLITSIVVLAVCIGAGIFFVTSRDEEPSTQPPAVNTEPSSEELNNIINPLTGERGFSEAAVGKRPVAFMINNAPAARPQWGLCTPDIVFEGLVEGGATRMMWVYADAEKIPEKIGSMRSARHDFLEIAESLDAVFVHWGGSTYAYDAMKERNPAHIDGIYIGSYSHRDNTRNTPIEHRGLPCRL